MSVRSCALDKEKSMQEVIKLSTKSEAYGADVSFSKIDSGISVNVSIASNADGSPVGAETELDQASVLRMRARLGQGIEMDCTRVQHSASFLIQIGIYRLRITRSEEGFEYILSDGAFVIGTATVGINEDMEMRERLGVADVIAITPAAELYRRAPVTDDVLRAAAIAAAR